MKHLAIFLFMLSISMTSFSQNVATDIIYPISDDAPINNCSIQDIQENVVFYIIDGKERRIEAIAVKRNGEYIDLRKGTPPPVPMKTPAYNQISESTYNGFDYQYYVNMQKRAKTTRGLGMGLTFGGVIFYFVGSNMLNNAGFDPNTETFENESKAGTGALLVVGGALSTLAGIPVWIVGGVKHKKATEGMAKTRNPNLSFNIGTTQNGVGLIVKF